MPAAVEGTEAKSVPVREELLWQALKEHIMLERQKKKEEQAAEVEEERLRKEREARDRQDAMTLGETREQIQLLNTRLEELRNEKQQLFLRLKKVLNEDENRKRQQQQKDSEMFALQNMVQQQGPHSQIFLPPRAPHQQLMQKYLQGNSPMTITGQPPTKRSRSPSPTQCYYKTNNPTFSPVSKHEDNRRSGEVNRNVLWNKPTYQNPAGTLYYPTTAPTDSRGPSIIYPTYQPHLTNPLRPTYHVEMQPQSQQPSSSSQQVQHIKTEPSKTSQGSAQVYHINLDQQQQAASHLAAAAAAQQHQQQQLAKQQQQQQQQHKSHLPGQQMSMDKPPTDRGYHLEMKHDDRKDRVSVQHQQQMQQQAVAQQQLQVQQQHQQPPPQQMQQGPPPPNHLPDGIVYTSMRPGIPPPQIHSTVTTFANQQPNTKPSGSITQGYSNRPPQRHFYYI